MVVKCFMLITEKWNLNPMLIVFFARKHLKDFEGTFGYGYVHHLAPFIYQFSVLLWEMVHLGSLLLIPPLLHMVWMICQFFLFIFKKLLNLFFCQEYLRLSDRHISLSWHVCGFCWCCLLGFCDFVFVVVVFKIGFFVVFVLVLDFFLDF